MKFPRIRNRHLPVSQPLGGLATLLVVALASAGLTAPLYAQDQGPQAQEAEDAEIVAWRERYLALGKDVFEWACAACHDVGDAVGEEVSDAAVANNAPQLGNRDNWSDRSPLWSAVLLEHAREGYLEMPAKGGHPYLSDRAVQAAGEYMLGVTFPEKPTD